MLNQNKVPLVQYSIEQMEEAQIQILRLSMKLTTIPYSQLTFASVQWQLVHISINPFFQVHSNLD